MSGGTWSSAPSMAEPRAFAVFAQLGNGKIVAATNANGGTALAEVLEDGVWSAIDSFPFTTDAEQGIGVVASTAGNGDLVLLLGNSAVRLNKSTLAWNRITLGMPHAHFRFAGVQLDSGDVLAIAGYQVLISSTLTAECHAFHPADDTYTLRSSLSAARAYHAAVMLTGDQHVLVAGGLLSGGVTATCERSTGKTATAWASAASMATARRSHGLLNLADGDVLAIGGMDSGGSALASVERYDADGDSWSTVAPMSETRSFITPLLLPDGTVFVSGGYHDPDAGTRISAELYDPVADEWTALTDMSVARAGHGVLLVNSDPIQVQVIGGENWTEEVDEYVAASEVWSPDAAPTIAVVPPIIISPLGGGAGFGVD